MASRTPPKPARSAACPICGKPATPESRPFCSPRSRQVDLNRWLTGVYAIPVVEEDGGGDEGEA